LIVNFIRFSIAATAAVEPLSGRVTRRNCFPISSPGRKETLILPGIYKEDHINRSLHLFEWIVASFTSEGNVRFFFLSDLFSKVILLLSTMDSAVLLHLFVVDESGLEFTIPIWNTQFSANLLLSLWTTMEYPKTSQSNFI
jgi:hypothetical protein